MTPPSPAASDDCLAVIDLEASFSPDPDARRAVARRIAVACRAPGLFYVRSPRLPALRLPRQRDQARSFFALPQAEKDAVAMRNTAGMLGYEPMQAQTLDVGTPADLKEAFMLRPEAGADDRDGWRTPWPDGPAGFREQMLAYADHLVSLGRHLFACLALSLDLPETYFEDGLRSPGCHVKILHYPPRPDSALADQLGAGAHTDWGGITMLLQDDIGGLEVQDARGHWIGAPPIAGTLVINLGDMVRRWTNDTYCSASHRVRNNTSSRDRYSVATFFSPDRNHRVECVPTCRPANGVPNYPSCTVGEHMDEMFRLTYPA